MDVQNDKEATVATIGEFGLISHIADIVGAAAVPLGIGDDAAVIDVQGDEYLLATVDMLVQDIHFRLGTNTPQDVGRRLFEVSASDIASMGGRPTVALTSLALPPSTALSFVDGVYEGLRGALARGGAALVGGNLTRTSGPIVLDLTLLGLVPKSDLVTRTGARPGDVLAVTGTLGDAAAVRLAIERGVEMSTAEMKHWMADHLAPTARVAEGRALASSRLVHAMMDISDGLASDVHHLCEVSGVGVVIEESSLPVSEAVRTIAAVLPPTSSELALSGGEDYELLVAISPDDVETARRLIAMPLTVVGRVVGADEGVMIRRVDSVTHRLEPCGWTHF